MKETTEVCLLCGNELIPILERLWDDRFGAPGYYTIAKCRFCGTEQTIPRPSTDALRSLYERYYNFGSAEIRGRKRYEKFRERLIDSALYRFWLLLDGDISFHRVPANSIVASKRLLDVGCNEGRGMERFRANGFEVEGLEVNRVAADAAQARGFKVYTAIIEDLHVDVPFNVIVFSNVLEHTANPRAVLRAANRLLGKGGEIWISLPNSGSIFRKIFGRGWINWHVPYHLVHFRSQTLLALLRQENFTSHSCKSLTPALWIVQTVLATIFAKPGVPTKQLRQMLVVTAGIVCVRLLFFPILWLANAMHRGDALLIRARRVD